MCPHRTILILIFGANLLAIPCCNGEWLDCPANESVYDGCQFTIHALFVANASADELCSSGNDYTYTIRIVGETKKFEYKENSGVVVVPIDESDLICNISTTFTILNMEHNVTFIAAHADDTLNRIKCTDILQVYDEPSPPLNITTTVLCNDSLLIEWNPPLDSFGIYGYSVNISNDLSYSTSDTTIVLNILDTGLALTETYQVNISAKYCGGFGNVTSTDIIIPYNRPNVSENIEYSIFANNDTFVGVILSATIYIQCTGSYPTALKVSLSCSDDEDTALALVINENLTTDIVGFIGTIDTKPLTLPRNITCNGLLTYTNEYHGNVTNVTSKISLNTNLEYCSVGSVHDCDYSTCKRRANINHDFQSRVSASTTYTVCTETRTSVIATSDASSFSSSFVIPSLMPITEKVPATCQTYLIGLIVSAILNVIFILATIPPILWLCMRKLCKHCPCHRATKGEHATFESSTNHDSESTPAQLVLAKKIGTDTKYDSNAHTGGAVDPNTDTIAMEQSDNKGPSSREHLLPEVQQSRTTSFSSRN